MMFNIYDRYEIEVERRAGRWVVHRLGSGTRREDHDIFVPRELSESDVAGHLEDLLHELSAPGRSIRRVD